MRVLIAHPCTATRGWLRLALLREPARFDEVGTAPEALDRLAEARHDLVVLGQDLAGMPGTQLLAALRTAGLATPIVLLAPLCRDAVRSLVRKMDRAVLVDVPYDVHALREAVQPLLPRGWSRQASVGVAAA